MELDRKLVPYMLAEEKVVAGSGAQEAL